MRSETSATPKIHLFSLHFDNHCPSSSLNHSTIIPLSIQKLSLNLPPPPPVVVDLGHLRAVRAVLIRPRDEAAPAAEARGAVAVVDLHRQARKRLPPPHRIRGRSRPTGQFLLIGCMEA